MSHMFDEVYAVYDEIPRRARTTHRCNACRRRIERGDVYMSVHCCDGDGWETIRRCGACQLTHEHLRALDPGEMWPDERLSCGLDYVAEWEEQPPEDVAALPLLSDREAGQLLSERWESERRERLAAEQTRRALARAREEVRDA